MRPTRVEAVLAAVLTVLSTAEALWSDEQPPPTVLGLLVAVAPPVAVAWSRRCPEGAAAVGMLALLATSFAASESGTFGAGFAWLALAFGLAAWRPRPWPWLLAIVIVGTLRDLRTPTYDSTDAIVDWFLVGFTIWIGRLVQRRSAQATELDERLRVAVIDREEQTQRAVAEERAVIARELHDIVAHGVSLMVVQAGTAGPKARRTDAELAEVLSTIEQTGREALVELRRLLHVLRSPPEAQLHPVPDLGRLAELVEGFRHAGVQVEATLAPPDVVPSGIALCAYRAVQEGLTNAMRHAQGSPVEVEVTGDTSTLRVSVRDHGGAGDDASHGTGSGLVGLRERVLLCGGRITLRREASGHLLEVLLPLDQQPFAFDPVRPVVGGAPT